MDFPKDQSWVLFLLVYVSRSPTIIKKDICHYHVCSQHKVSVFSQYNQQDATFLTLFIPIGRSTCFRRFFRPSAGNENCIYSVRHLSDHYCYLLLA